MPTTELFNYSTTHSYPAQELITLVRGRYPAWDSCEHPPFVADEVAPRRAAARLAHMLLSRPALEPLIQTAQFAEILARLEQLSRATNLLWTAQPSRGDLAVLYTPSLPQPAYYAHLFNLLHGADAIETRLNDYTDFLTRHALPNTWPLPTYLLALLEPAAYIFVKPRLTQWFLQFAGAEAPFDPAPGGAVYATIIRQAQVIQAALVEQGAPDLLAVQSLVWVAYQVSRERIGRLTLKDQVELNQPPDEEPLYQLAAGDAGLLATPLLAIERTDTASDNLPMVEMAEATPYDLARLIEMTGLEADQIETWVAALHRKGQAILYGPPGTGKTFLARQLARFLVSGGDGFVELVQFHPAYAYEDFIQGIRPISRAGQLHYENRPGLFLDFCRRAAACQGVCVLIIDEINRADLPRVLGELMYLLEYRQAETALAGGGALRIPANVRLLGTMNTADRSIALVDYALRRRFAFIPLRPNYALLRRFHAATEFEATPLIAILTELNQHLEPDYQVGVSYFLQPNLAATLPSIWQLEIEPYLEEYFYNQRDAVEPWRWAAVAQRLAA